MEPLLDLYQFVHMDYVVAVIMVTELLRYVVRGIDKYVRPRYLSALMGLALFIIWIYAYDEPFNLIKMLSSYSLAVLGYQFIVQPIKQKYFPEVTKKQQE